MKTEQSRVVGFGSSTPTEQFDDVRMVEVLHAGRLIQELFNLPLREAVHCLKKDEKVKYLQVYWV